MFPFAFIVIALLLSAVHEDASLQNIFMYLFSILSVRQANKAGIHHGIILNKEPCVFSKRKIPDEKVKEIGSECA
jgi:hypothetical protein